jgi:hypothetical protein
VKVKEFRRFTMQGKETSPHRVPRFIFLAHCPRLDPNARTFRQLLCRVDEPEILVGHHEPNWPAPGATAKALKYLPLWIHRE